MTERSVSIIMLAYNEEHNLHAAVLDVLTAARLARLDDFEILLVNDGSTDGTGRIADCLSRQCAQVRAIHHPHNAGLRAGYESGLAAASLAYTVWFPSDGEMARDSIQEILTAVGTADLVIPYHGTPERRGWYRRLLTWGSTSQLNALLGHNLHYFQGTVVYPTALARSLPRTEGGFFFCAEMLAHALDAGLTYVEIPLEHVQREYGESKALGLSKIWAAQKLIVRLWWRLRVRTAFQALGWALEHR